jgi:hypothetical protein
VRETAVEDSGPDGDNVAVLLPISFRSSARGRTYQVEVRGTDDGGAVLGFAAVGALVVGAS